MSFHYLDNSATTKVCKEAAEKALYYMTEKFGNPSSLHTMGFEAKCVLDEARETIAKSIGSASEEIIFTSGGTESNNLAIIGAVKAKRRLGNKIITSAIEHPAVLEVMKNLEKNGMEVVYLSPNEQGIIEPKQIEKAVDDKTILISMMLVNNETGMILPVQALRKIAAKKKSPALIHTDAVQGYLKMPFTVKKLGVDLLTISGHKAHAPKGVGALYISKQSRIQPILHGGGQEKGIRNGTEALPLIAAFAEAVKQTGSIRENHEKAESLNKYLREKLNAIPQIVLNSPQDGLPYILNLSTQKVRSETMLHFLADKNVFVSSGSACARGKLSHVLTEFGYDKRRINTAIRVSFSKENTEKDVDAFVRGLMEGMGTLASE